MSTDLPPEPLVLHDMPTADEDWAVVALPVDTPGEAVERIRSAVRSVTTTPREEP